MTMGFLKSAGSKVDAVEVTYDRDADAVYLRLSERAPYEAYDTAGGLTVHVDQDGRVVGIEVLGASDVLAPGAWRSAPAPDPAPIAAE